MTRKALKTIILAVSTVVLCCVLTLTAFAATQNIQETKTVNAPYGTPVIDGKPDSIWQSAEKIYFEYDRQGCSETKLAPIYKYEDESKKHWAKVMWDDTYLYVYYHVFDSNLNKGENIKTYNRDGIEFYVDEFNDKAFKKEDCRAMNQLVINIQGAYTDSDKSEVKSSYMVYFGTTAYYVIEARYKFTDLAPYPGAVIGFDASINCNDTGEDVRDHCLSWNDRTNTTWEKPVYMGECVLTADGYDFAKDFEYTVNEDDGTVSLTKYTGNGGIVQIPGEIDGLPVTSIEYEVFTNYEGSIRKIIISSSISYIDGIGNAYDLEEIEVDENNEYFTAIDGVLYSKSQKILYCFPRKHGSESFTVPDSVAMLSYGAFFDANNLKKLILPDSLKYIESENFRYCDTLTEITVPENVEYIGESCFADCKGLTSISILTRSCIVGSGFLTECEGLQAVYLYRESGIASMLTEHDIYYLDDQVVMSLSNARAVGGRTVEVDLVIKSNPGVAGIKIKLGYDSDILTLKDVSHSSWECTTSFTDDETSNPVTLVFYRTRNYNGTGEIATLTFEVAENAPLGKTIITFDPDIAIVDQDKVHLPYKTFSGGVTVTSSVPGDLNRDGEIGIADTVLMAQYLANWEIEIDLEAADCRRDGKVDIFDGILLAQYLANWKVSLG